MIEYNVYWTSKSEITGEPLTWIQGKFYTEDNAKLFMKAIKKAHPNDTYFIDKWDPEKRQFVK